MRRITHVLLLFALAVLTGCGQRPLSAADDPLDRGLAAYERVRALLAEDRTEGLAEAAAEAAEAFDVAADEATGSDRLRAAARSARRLSEATDIGEARESFGELSEHVVAVVASDPARQTALYRFSCPMAPGLGEWVQPSPDIENPYMGTSMPTCGSAETWGPVTDHTHDGDDIAYWTCSMHPSVKEAGPGTCPICSMDLTPVTEEELRSGAVLIDAVRRQRYGVRTAPAERRALVAEVRATGSVRWDESRLADVTLRAGAWVEALHVHEPGAEVRRGAPLATLYSPALYAAQRELLATRGTALEGATRERLRLFGLQPAQIEAVLSSGVASDTVELLAPISGVVVDKDVVEGAHLAAGSRLFRLAGLQTVWVEAEVYEDDLDLVYTGMHAALQPVGSPALSGTVEGVEPWVEPTTRRATVRVVVANPDGALTPGRYVDMTLRSDLGEVLAVPAEAVIYTGRRRIVFVDEGDERLVPRDVELGRRAGDWFEVSDGLEAGQLVVSSGNFVVAAESRIRAAETYWGADHGAR